MALRNLLLGEAGRLRVASEMMLRNHHVFLPTVDDGIDLFTESGLRIQVKSAHKVQNRYYANFRHWSMREGKRKQESCSLRQDLSHLIIFGVDDNCFWIIPREIIRNSCAISVQSPTFNFRRTNRLAQYMNNWDILKER